MLQIQPLTIMRTIKSSCLSSLLTSTNRNKTFTIQFKFSKNNKDLTTFHTSFLEQITLDYHFTTEQAETSENRPYTFFNVISETSFDNGNNTTASE